MPKTHIGTPLKETTMYRVQLETSDLVETSAIEEVTL